MGFISDKIGGFLDDVSGASNAMDAAREAGQISQQGWLEGASTAAGGQRAERDYLLRNTLAERQGSTGAQRNIMGLYGLKGGVGDQESFIEDARSSPIYSAIMQTRDAGEDAILRNASATGGLRSGDASSNLYQYNQQLEEDALLEAYNQRLGGLRDIAGWDTQDALVAPTISAPAETLGQGVAQGAQSEADALIAAAQSQQAGRGSLIDAGSSLLGSSKFWSDRRLKDHVRLIGQHDGMNLYEWVWNKLAEPLGLDGYGAGVMADEIEHTHPEAVDTDDGYKTVNYRMLGLI